MAVMRTRFQRLRSWIEVCQEILEYRDDAVPTDVPGQFYAKSKTGDFVRTDGKYMNVAYRRDRITG